MQSPTSPRARPCALFDRKRRVLVILDGTNGWIHYVTPPPTTAIFDPPPGFSPSEARELEHLVLRSISEIKTTGAIQIGDPPVLWSAVCRVPDGAVAQDERQTGDAVSFILRARDQSSHYRFTFAFRGASLDWARSSIRSVAEPQLRSWEASAWWPKGWRVP